MTIHKPVLLRETLEYLDPQSGENFIDGTFGGGGHTQAILEKTSPDGRVLAIDQDVTAINNFKKQTVNNESQELVRRIVFVNDNFENIKIIAQEKFPYPIAGILLDIGFSSDQLEHSGRGFSFQIDEPLDMRMSLDRTVTAAKIVNSWPISEIERILRVYGEEKNARKISEAIVGARKRYEIKTTFALRDIIISAMYSHARRASNKGSLSQTGSPRPGKINPATKTFQALRIAVNQELEILERVLPEAFALLSPGGRLVVLSFHGLEDKIVKQFAKQYETKTKNFTKKPLQAQSDELRINPRARSARLRGITKIYV